jgi:hypothetical protein
MFNKQVEQGMLHLAVRRAVSVFVLAGAVVAVGTGLCASGMAAQDAKQEATPDVGVVLKIQTNEVVLDVVARDRRNNPVNDLKQEEFQVFEVGKHADKAPRRILSMRTIDPHKDESRAGRAESGFKISSGAVCALRMVTHYELAIVAAGEPGYHPVVLKTSRKDVTLSYRRRYYVAPQPSGAQASADASAKGSKVKSDDIALGEAACYHPLVPPTLAITAHPSFAAGEDATRYQVVVRPESLAGIGLTSPDSKVKLDFGICLFDATGLVLGYMKSSADQTVAAADFADIQARGFSTLLQVPGKQSPYLARVAVRERETGNVGVVDVARPITAAEQAERMKMIIRQTGFLQSFGTVTPRENTFCGDVYELSSGIAVLPDFWNLDPVGSIYTEMLNVPEQDISGQQGIPGITRTTIFFGVDYWGEFYITEPGDYTFELNSDDGSKLEIDNQEVIEVDGLHPPQAKSGHVNLGVGRHTIHVPYFQGTPTLLALILRIKPPGKHMVDFYLKDYVAPKGAQ